MTPRQLREAAQEMYGRRGWITDLAAALKLNPSTIHRYLSGQLPIPGPVEAAVPALLKNFRADTLRRLTSFKP